MVVSGCLSSPQDLSHEVSPICIGGWLGEIVQRFSVRYLQYADDTQLYLSSSDPSPTASVLSQFLAAVGGCMWLNQLKLNPDKMKGMVVHRPHFLGRIGMTQ